MYFLREDGLQRCLSCSALIGGMADYMVGDWSAIFLQGVCSRYGDTVEQGCMQSDDSGRPNSGTIPLHFCIDSTARCVLSVIRTNGFTKICT